MNDQRQAVGQDRVTVKQALRAFFPKYLAIWIHSIFITFLAFTPFLYMMQIHERVHNSRSWETLWFLTGIIGFALIVHSALTYFRGNALASIGEQINEQLRAKIFTIVHETGKNDAFRFYADVATLRSGLTGSFISSAFDATLSPLFLVVLFVLHPVFGIVAIVYISAIGILSIIQARIWKRVKSEVKPLEDQAFAFGLATAAKHEAIKSMSILPGVRREWLKLQAQAVEALSEGQRGARILDAVLGLMQIGQLVLIIGVGAILYLLDEITSSVGFAAFIIMMRGVSPVLALVKNLAVIEETRGAYLRLENLLSEADETAPIAQNTLVGEISCENVGFYAENRQPILQGIGFLIPAGSVLGVIGPSGAGKSTLLRLLAGAQETHTGAIKVDGFPVSQWPANVIGRERGYLPQSVDLLPGTIWENVARFDTFNEATNDKVIAALERAGALPIVQAKRGGLNFPLSIDGTPLSGGQKQRIGLARAFYGDPKLIVLDEPNSALDAEGEAALARSIRALKDKGSTVIFSTHKADMLELCDYLVVIMNGYMHSFSGKDDILDRIQSSGNKLITAETKG